MPATSLPETKIVDEHGKEMLLEELRRGDWIKAETVRRGDDLEIRKLTRRVRKDGELDKIAGEIDSLERKKERFTVGGVQVNYDDTGVRSSGRRRRAPPDELTKPVSQPPRRPSLLGARSPHRQRQFASRAAVLGRCDL